MTTASGRLREHESSPTWKRALVLTLLLRAAYSVFAAIVGLVQPVNWGLIRSNALTENLRPPDHSLHHLLFGVWQRFDTLWYLHIAAHGYDRPDAVVFFPLYPALIRVVSLVMPPIAAALLISTVASFFLFWGLQELLVGDEPPNLVDQALLASAVWPASFIFFAGYPESLLLALIVWSLCMARKEHWLAAAMLGVAAALTKAVGVVAIVPFIAMAVRQEAKRKAFPWLVVPLVGAVVFLRYLHWTTHAAISSAYEQYWRTSTALPWTTLWAGIRALAHAPNPILVINVIFLIVIPVLVAVSRLRIEYLLFSAVAIVVFLCKETNPPLQSIIRYLLILFPAYAGFARLWQGEFWQPRFKIVCAALFVVNLGLLWLFLGWSLVL